MRTEIKRICQIYVGDDIKNKLVEIEKRKRIKSILQLLEDCLEQIKEESWTRIKNRNVYYIEKYRILIPNIMRSSNAIDKLTECFPGDNQRFLTHEEAKDLFFENKSLNPLVEANSVKTVQRNYAYIYFSDIKPQTEGVIQISDGYIYQSGFYDQYDYIKIPAYALNKKISKLELFIRENLILEGLDENIEKLFIQFSALYKEKLLPLPLNKSNLFIEAFTDAVMSQNYAELNGITLDDLSVKPYVEEHMQDYEEDIRKLYVDDLLNCDYRRAEIEPYDIGILEDVKRGHWELWERERDRKIQEKKKNTASEKEQKNETVNISKGIIMRNPLADIQENSIVGIDFGTRSTVVLCQNDDGYIRPMRVGDGNYKRADREEDYENPTVMEFRDIKNFIRCYRKKDGRPETLWEDLTISHKAAEQLKSEKDSNKFYSFFSDLKQWCGDRDRVVRIVDNKGFGKELRPFIGMKQDIFDPIELYAYYLGLYINNMRQKIHLNYLLSFPITFEKTVKDKMLRSFKEGIKKSLPEIVLNDKEAMKKLNIRHWSSEPAAYAICALTQYGFKPKNEEMIAYGIFDFGGGTTDFDFGIWRASKIGRYDYEIEHFGDGGDRYLGGENLLEMLAFHVFWENRKILFQEGIPFFRPHDCENVVGGEGLICDSQEARLNIRQLMEKLRGLWQNDNEEDIRAIEEGRIRLMLFTNKKNELKPNFELQVNKDELLLILRHRIERGVRSFFIAMAKAFSGEQLKSVEMINIFLAGNSSKSNIVQELFEEYSINWTEKIKDMFKDKIFFDPEETFFKVFPPLGTMEALKEQKERGTILNEKRDLNMPTGKTGVAYGLIQGRPGSRIKIISKIESGEEIRFRYYIGQIIREKFEISIDRDTEYGRWIYFIDATEKEFELYYTDSPGHILDINSLDGMRVRRCNIINIYQDENVGVYIRAIGPTSIEYAVGTQEDITKGKYKEIPKRMSLS